MTSIRAWNGSAWVQPKYYWGLRDEWLQYEPGVTDYPLRYTFDTDDEEWKQPLELHVEQLHADGMPRRLHFLRIENEVRTLAVCGHPIFAIEMNRALHV